MNFNERRLGNTLLEHLIEDKNVRIKNSQSAQIYESTTGELDQLYQHVCRRLINYNIAIQDETINLNSLKGSYGKQQMSITDYFLIKNDKAAYITKIFDYFIAKEVSRKQKLQDSNQIQCVYCKNYEQNLQKLQNDIRQHIRLEQQLKLYQEGLQEKIQQQKKDCEKNHEKISHLKLVIQEHKTKENSLQLKINKLEEELDQFKNKSGLIAENTRRLTRQVSQGKSFKALAQLKQNNNSIPFSTGSKKQMKKQPRKSCEKKPLSTERPRQPSLYPNSNIPSQTHNTINLNHKKQYPLTQKLMMDKNKQQKRKTLQAKFNLR